MAKYGMKPVVSIYSSFLQRAYDQIIHDICIQKLPVVICIDRAGVVGNDGETHQGIFDLSFLSHMPNLAIMAPKNYKELENMLEFACNANYPTAIRYPKGEENIGVSDQGDPKNKIELGKAEIIKEGKDMTICAIGKMVAKAIEVANILSNIDIEIINVRFLKPIDEKTILNSINKTKKLVTIEDNVLKGGLASAIREIINNDVKMQSFGYPDKFIEHGNIEQIEMAYGLDASSIAEKIEKIAL